MIITFQSIARVNINDFVQTRWHNDLVHFKVSKIITIGGQFKRWEVEAEIYKIDLDYYDFEED